MSDSHEVLSREKLKLSVNDRINIQQEVHGVQCMAVDETPDLIEHSLRAFERELMRIPDSQKETYTRIATHVTARRLYEVQQNEKLAILSGPYGLAQNIAPHQHEKHYAIDDDDFRLRFLRYDLFNVQKAAMRFIRYLDIVQELWGFDIVSQRLTRMDDFSHEELRILKKGFFQILPFRDRSGRKVISILGDRKNDAPRIETVTLAKLLFYLFDVATRDCVESQQRGVVAVGDTSGIRLSLSLNLGVAGLQSFARFHRASPSRIVSRHLFIENNLNDLLVKWLELMAKNMVAARYTIHIGCNEIEMKGILKCYGIPSEYFPLTETGTIKVKNMNIWIRNRYRFETNGFQSQHLLVECPCLNDVIFRQGRTYNGNPGNYIFRECILKEINRKIGENEPESEHEKNQSSHIDNFFKEVKNAVYTNRGRFLKWDNKLQTWVQMTDEAKIKRKVVVSIYNFEKNHTFAISMARRDLLHGTSSPSSDIDDSAYAFIEGGKPNDGCCSVKRHSTNWMGGQSKKPWSG